MPIYEYQCQQCGHHFETMQKISDAPLSECSACGGVLEKQWSQTSFQLKGGGWYVSDYGKGGVVPKKSESTAVTEKSGDTATPEKSEKSAGEMPKTESAKPDTPAPAAAKSE